MQQWKQCETFREKSFTRLTPTKPKKLILDADPAKLLCLEKNLSQMFDRALNTPLVLVLPTVFTKAFIKADVVCLFFCFCLELVFVSICNVMNIFTFKKSDASSLN